MIKIPCSSSLSDLPRLESIQVDVERSGKKRSVVYSKVFPFFPDKDNRWEQV